MTCSIRSSDSDGASPAITACPKSQFFDRSSLGDGASSSGAQWSNVMSSRELRAEDNLLSAFALMIGGALGVGVPVALIIIWLCS
jgi:hypothetical protein